MFRLEFDRLVCILVIFLKKFSSSFRYWRLKGLKDRGPFGHGVTSQECKTNKCTGNVSD